jgi:hypothetical protein
VSVTITQGPGEADMVSITVCVSCACIASKGWPQDR